MYGMLSNYFESKLKHKKLKIEYNGGTLSSNHMRSKCRIICVVSNVHLLDMCLTARDDIETQYFALIWDRGRYLSLITKKAHSIKN